MNIKKFLSIMSRKTKVKCAGIIFLAFVSSLLASLWPVRLAALYTNISNGTINSLTKGAFAVVTFGLIYLSAECITILRRVMLDCVIATHESEVRENSVEKLLKMPVSYYSGTLSGEKTAQLNQGVAGFSQLIKIMVEHYNSFLGKKVFIPYIELSSAARYDGWMEVDQERITENWRNEHE